MQTRRRDFLKASALLGLSANAPLLLNACGGDDAPPDLGARETRHLHFDLSAAPVGAPTLHALNSRHHRTPLLLHDAASRARHRALDPALASLPDEQLTHYLEDVDLPAGALQGLQVLGKLPGTQRDALVVSHIHVPSGARAAAQQRRSATRTSPLALTGQDSLGATISPFDAAVYLVFHHPEVMNLNPTLGAEILERIANLPCDPNDASCLPLISPLAEAIARSIEDNGWPSTTSGGWMTLIPMTASDGTPVLGEQGEQLYRYDIDDAIAETTGEVVKVLLKNIFDDTLFEGTNWRAPATAASATLPAAAAASARQPATARREVAMAASAAFDIEAHIPVGSSASGIRMVGLTVADAPTRLVRLTVNNDYLRFLSVYVQYLDAAEQPLPITAPDSLDSDRARYVMVIGSNNQLMGIPFQGGDVSSTDIEFSVPDEAAHANLMFGSLGLGGDAFSQEAVAGASLTLALNIGIPTMLLAAGVYADVQAGILGLFKNGPLLKELLTTLLSGLRNAGGNLATSIYGSATSDSAESFLVTFAGVALQALLEAAPTLLIYLSGAIGSATLFAAALGPVGIAIKVLSVLADLASIAVTVGEVLASPAITINKVSLKMDTLVRIGKDRRDFQFPASATSYQVDANYDGGSKPRTVKGSIAPGSVTPIDVTLTGVPSGGNVVISVSLYSDDGCLVGSATSDSIANLPASAAEIDLQIVELVAALKPDTQYQHRLKLGYATGARTWQPASAPTATRTSLCQGSSDAICALNGLTVHTASGMAGYGFLAGGQNVGACGGGTGDVLNTIQNQFLGANPDSATKFSSCGSTQPIGIVYDPLGPVAGGHHFFVQPAADGSFDLRGVSLDGTPFDMQQTTSWGRFTNALDSLAVMPAGYVVGVNRTTHKMEVLLLPQTAADPTFAPRAIPFAAMKAGQGSRAGLLDTPVAVATAQGAILVLEQGNARVQALDPDGSPVNLFKQKSTNLMPLQPEAGAVYLDLAVESQGYVYVLSYLGDGLTALDYRLDVYTPDGEFLSRTAGVAAARLAVDLFRNLYTLNYEPLAGSPRLEPTVSQWLPVTPDACPTTLPTSAASSQLESRLAWCDPRSRLAPRTPAA